MDTCLVTIPTDRRPPWPFENPASKFLRALVQMGAERPPRLDLFFVAGFSDSLRFLVADDTSMPGCTRLDPSDIASVAWAWGDHESDDWHGGFVLDLHSGGRVYLETKAEGMEWGPGSTATLTRMRPGAELPTLPGHHRVMHYGWHHAPSEMQEFLLRLAGI